jgi:predicted transcriptional regulator
LGKRPSVHAFRLREHGLERVLGGIEAAVMEILWSRGEPCSIAEVRAALAPARPLSFNAVMTVMNNLVAKGCLERSRAENDRSYRYRARVSREAFVGQVTREVAQGLVRDFGPLAVAQFLDVLREEDPASLQRLRQWLEEGAEGADGRK